MGTVKKPAVLVVEDDEAMRAYLVRSLKNAGYDVYEADRGTEGIAIFSMIGENAHVVVSDIVMPTMDGLEFCQLISSTARHIFEFIFITGFSQGALKASQNFPGNRVVQKPFHLRDLVLEIDRAMVRVIHKRKRLSDHLSANMNEKLDRILVNIEGKIEREERASLRSEANTIIYGSGNTISISNDLRSIDILNKIVPGKLSTLESALEEIGISPRYVESLKLAIERDKISGSKELVGGQSEKWLKRTLRSVGKGTSKVAGDIATTMLTKIVSVYFGFPV
jgi:two-component system, cell cycle response regulator CpdR